MSEHQDEPRSTPRPGPRAPGPHVPGSLPPDRAQDGTQDDELLRAQALLARTMRFLAHCAQDPEAAVLAEDPQALIHDLESLAVEGAPGNVGKDGSPKPEETTSEPRTIHLRRRKSA